MKKSTSSICSFVLCMFMVLSSSNLVLAAENNLGNNDASYLFENESYSMKYYLDEEGNPYIVNDNEILYVFLPLEENRVTDPDELARLNMLFDQQRDNPPTNYYDMSTGSPTNNSITYSIVGANFAAGNVWSTYLKYNTAHATLRIKTSNHNKKHFYSSVKIDFTAYYYDVIDQSWFSTTYSNKDCSGPNGFGILVPFSIDQYGQFCFSSDNLNSADINVWTSPAS